MSEKYGLKVKLCWQCHRDNRKGVHGNAEKMEELHRTGQRAFEARYPEKSFIGIFGKNYLSGGGEREQETPVKTGLDGFIWIGKGEEDEPGDTDGKADQGSGSEVFPGRARDGGCEI